MLEVPQAERTGRGIEGKRNLAAFEHRSVLIAKDRQQHLAAELLTLRLPLDVEVTGIARRRPVLQHIEPPAVVGLEHAHVIGHDVDHQRHPMAFKLADQRVEIFGGSDFRIERAVVDDVVPVQAAGTRLQERRCVEMADAKPCEIRHDCTRRAEIEIAIELNAIRSARDRAHRTAPRSASPMCQTTDHGCSAPLSEIASGVA